MPNINVSNEELATIKNSLDFGKGYYRLLNLSFTRQEKEDRIAALDAALAALQAPAQGEWEPLPDGRYDLDTEERSYLVVENNGEYGYQRTEQVFPGWDEFSQFYWTKDIRLCRRTSQPAGVAGRPLDIPDAIGWWGFEDPVWESYEVVEIVKWEIKDDVVTVRFGHAPSRSEDIVQHVAEFRRQNKVKWYRLHMPWERQRPGDAQP